MKLHVLKGDPATIQSNLREKNIMLNNPAKDLKGFYIKINPSLLRADIKKLIQYFIESAG